MRPVVKLHTIEQWETIDAQTKSIILQNIRLKDRLAEWMKARSARGPLQQSVSEKCYRCEGSGIYTNHPRLTGIHPSQIATQCLLKVYYQMVGEEPKEKFDFRTELIFDLGKHVHLMFQGYGKQRAWGPMYKDEVRISEDLQDISWRYFLEGSADADNILVIDDIPNHPIYEVGVIHEYKSINDANYKKLTGPLPKHKLQAIIYTVALNRPVVVYMNLNTNDSNISDFPIAFEHRLWVVLEDKLRRLNAFYDRGEEPPGTYEKFSCKDCAFNYKCPEYDRMKKEAAK